MVLKADGSQAPFMPEDFGIGIDVSIFGKIMRIYDCDDYTRQFFTVSNLPIRNVKDFIKSLETPGCPFILPCKPEMVLLAAQTTNCLEASKETVC